MKIILLGKSGMLGHDFLRSMAGLADFEMYAFGRKELDITDFEKVSATMRQIHPDIVINCVAYTNVDQAEQEKEKAFAVNCEAVKNLAATLEPLGALLVHFSTDYVFDGAAPNGYLENAKPNPLNVYGDSKLGGERAIQDLMENYYIIRTSSLFGANERNFVRAIVNKAMRGEDLKVVNDQFSCPTYSLDLAQAVIREFLGSYFSFIPFHHPYHYNSNQEPMNRVVGSVEMEPGLYHLTNFGALSWYEFAKEIVKMVNLDVKISPIESGQLSRPALRPQNSILLSSKTSPLRSWREALADYIGLSASEIQASQED